MDLGWDDICEDFHSFIVEEPQAIRPDTRAALELAQRLGFRQCVLSALRQDLLARAIAANGLDGFFERCFGVDNLDGASKLQRGRELMASLDAADDVVFVGDTLHDAEVARELGAACVLVSCGHQMGDRLTATGCPVADSLVGAVHIACNWAADMV